MKISKSTTRTVTLDLVAAHELEADTDPYSVDLRLGDESETDTELCPICHDLLAWHEQACQVALAPQPDAQPDHDTPDTSPAAPASSFAYSVGHRVQPATSAPAIITWRGQHKERHPTTGFIQRINVYYLDNGYWDCYREEELQAA